KGDTVAKPAAKADDANAKTNDANAKSAPPAKPQVWLGDTGAEEAPPSDSDLVERKQAEVYATGIRYVMRSHQAQVGGCYERAFKDEDRSPGGRVEVAFTVGKEGRAGKIEVLSNTTGKEVVGTCLAQRVKDWTFPRPPAGEFQASYPFVFSAGAGR